MSEFKEYSLSQFAEINPKVSLKGGGSYPFIEMKDLDAKYKFAKPSACKTLTGGARFENGDTLFARITPCLENGKICQVSGLDGGKGFGSTEFLVFRGRKGISDGDFVYYLCQTPTVRRYAEQHLVGTSGRQRVAKEAFDNLILELPLLPKQQRIAEILSSLDDKIELNRQMNQTLEEMAQAMFKHYFVDGIDKDNLPDGWRMGRLNELMEFRNGKSSPFRDSTGLYKVYGANGVIGLADNFNANEDTVVIGRVGSFCGSLHLSMEKCWVTDNAIIGNILEQYFCYTVYLLKTLQLNNLRVGSGQPLLNQGILSSIDVVIPPIEISTSFNNDLYSYTQLAWQNENEIEALAETRNYLLPKLISGEVIPADLKQLEQAL